jgi:hypothetical protein
MVYSFCRNLSSLNSRSLFPTCHFRLLRCGSSKNLDVMIVYKNLWYYDFDCKSFCLLQALKKFFENVLQVSSI